MFRNHLPYIFAGIFCLKGEGAHLHLPVLAGDLKAGIIPQKGVTAPLLVIGDGLQKIAVAGNIFQDL